MSLPSTLAADSRRGRSVILICFAVLLIEGYDLAMFGTIVPDLRDYEPWGLSASMIGYMGSAAVIGMLFGALSAAGLADRYGRRPVIIGAVTTFSIAMALGALAPTPEFFLATRFIVGLGAGAVMPTATATLLEFAPADRRNRNMAFGFIGVGIGGMAAAGLAIWLIPLFGFRAMCIIGALPLVVLVPFLSRYLPESIGILLGRGEFERAHALTERHGVVIAPDQDGRPALPAQPKGIAARFAAVFSDRRGLATVLFWTATFVCLLVNFGVSTWLADLMESAGYGGSTAIGFIIALKFGAVVGVLAAAYLADRFGQKQVVITTFFACGLALVLLATTPPTVIAFALVAVVGLGTVGLQTLINAYVGAYYPAEIRATGLGLNLSIGRIGGIVGPIYLGALASAGLGFDLKLYSLAIPAVIGGVLVCFIPRRSSALGLPTDPPAAETTAPRPAAPLAITEQTA